MTGFSAEFRIDYKFPDAAARVPLWGNPLDNKEFANMQNFTTFKLLNKACETGHPAWLLRNCRVRL